MLQCGCNVNEKKNLNFSAFHRVYALSLCVRLWCIESSQVRPKIQTELLNIMSFAPRPFLVPHIIQGRVSPHGMTVV